MAEKSEEVVGSNWLGSLSSDNGNGNENVTWKYNFITLVLPRDYFNSLNFYRNGELSRNQIGVGVVVKKENEKFPVMCSRSPKNLEFGHFTLLFCRGKSQRMKASSSLGRGQQRNVTKL